MRELTLTEIDEINGGAAHVPAVIIALGTGLVSDYLFQAAGGYDGINSLIQQFGANFYSWAGDFYSTYGMSNK